MELYLVIALKVLFAILAIGAFCYFLYYYEEHI